MVSVTTQDRLGGAGASRPRYRTADFFILFLAALAAVYGLIDHYGVAPLVEPRGWDARSVCAASDAWQDGRDPYVTANLANTHLSYPYLPITLDLIRPICRAGYVDHYGAYDAAMLAMAVLLLCWAQGKSADRSRITGPVFLLAGFAGVEWVAHTGNIVVFDSLLTTLALALLCLATRNPAPPAGTTRGYRLAACLLGLTLSIKIIYAPAMAALLLVPLPLRTRLRLVLIALLAYASPIALSALLHPDLMQSWIDGLIGATPQQHSPATEACSVSLYCGIHGWLVAPLGAIALYGASVLGIAMLFVLQVARAARRDIGGERKGRIDRLLMQQPRFALHLVFLAFYVVLLSAPRLKEYTFLNLAVCGALLLPALPLPSLCLAYAIGIGLPILSNQPLYRGTSLFFAGFDQTVAALAIFGILLWQLGPTAERFKRQTARSV